MVNLGSFYCKKLQKGKAIKKEIKGLKNTWMGVMLSIRWSKYWHITKCHRYNITVLTVLFHEYHYNRPLIYKIWLLILIIIKINLILILMLILIVTTISYKLMVYCRSHAHAHAHTHTHTHLCRVASLASGASPGGG